LVVHALFNSKKVLEVVNISESIFHP